MAAENGFDASVRLSQDFTDNYLMTSSDPQTLSGLYLIPTLDYKYGNGVESFLLSARGSIERFNKSEFNGEYPVLHITFKELMERSSFTIDYDLNQESTRVSEFNDSGTIEKVASNKTSGSTKVVWQFQLDPTNSISISGSHQSTAYESETYADLINNSLQVNWQYRLSERVSTYLGLSTTRYESKYANYFPIAPQLLLGHLFCPPNLVLVSESACGFVRERGKALNITDSKALQAGFSWDIYEQIKFSSGVGVAPSETVQHIDIPTIAVPFGQPINEDIVFGGKRQIKSESKILLANMGLTYKRETTSFDLTMESRIQPSSTGTLWKTQSLALGVNHSMSELTSLGIDFNYSNLHSLDEKVISASIDRDIVEGHIKFSHSFTPTLSSTFSIGYRYQKENTNTDLVADAFLGSFSIGYTPKEWTW